MDNTTPGLMLALGIAAGIFTAVSLLPQVIKMIKTKKAEHISPWMNIVLMCGLLLWMVYGILKKDWPIILTNAFSMVLNIIMLALRGKYKE